MLEILYIVIMMLFLFGITIFVHEWGHFIVARKLGLVAETFSIGMGPALWQKEINGVVYKIGAFPIGGYVSLPQLDPEGMEKVQGGSEADREALPDVSPWKKIAVSVAGPLCNILFAVPLALLVTLAEPPPSNTAVGWVATNSTAYAEGLRAGDVILKVNDTVIEDWYGIVSEDLLTKDAGTFDLTYRSGAQTNVLTLDSEASLEDMAPAMLPLLASVSANAPAGAAGLKTGDLVTRIGDREIHWWHELAETLQDYKDVDTTITVERDGESLTLDITPEYNKDYEKVMIGVSPGDPGMLAWTMEGNAFTQLKSDGLKIFRLLKALTNRDEAGNAAKALGGPITIFAMIWFALKLGFFYAIGLMRFININLAVLNLLPIPVLDGGHICFALWEGITRRKVHPRVVAVLVNLFAILLISAMVYLSWRDSDRLWNVSRFFKKEQVEQVQPPSQTNSPAQEVESE